jgi:hypothetical protein
MCHLVPFSTSSYNKETGAEPFDGGKRQVLESLVLSSQYWEYDKLFTSD